ncbi:ArsR/SmtB family transcription factor [Pseudohoeflea coraliihabitans]|uniref:Metalloregulator ArsR/SmtB family transcription factor n=1 Tax=Pseudohoeflea coraliihabitans TaxID=2860393 RepID=A0ABS6WP46_9HYPH|nr:metalloregulator ArsR/SmtB family transcription factor [Pseudohoeflea sp. DP4N28-3]MBW3097398.1 metalloregulator ArsR/SmtB family transcription factor [Pseudohoeflea sp. DP4N28-3]
MMTLELETAKMYERAEDASNLLQAMANKNRLLILCNLVEGEASVTELIGRVGMNQSALSQQLAKLRAANLVATRRDGQLVYYRLASRNVERVLGLLYELYCKGH